MSIDLKYSDIEKGRLCSLCSNMMCNEYITRKYHCPKRDIDDEKNYGIKYNMICFLIDSIKKQMSQNTSKDTNINKELNELKNKLLNLVTVVEKDQIDISHYDTLNNNHKILKNIPDIIEKIDHLLSVETLINDEELV